MRFQTDDIISQLRTVLSRTGLALENKSDDSELQHKLPKREKNGYFFCPTLMLDDIPVLPSVMSKRHNAEVVYQQLRENGFTNYCFDEENWRGTIENCLIAQRYWLFVEECIKTGNLKRLDKFLRHKAKNFVVCSVI
ncbi:MAG: hypothetical protein IKZ88_09455 [Neisseriaceae bacterium]|nr:hypothetical protein [Neisseriaceae bacterium]